MHPCHVTLMLSVFYITCSQTEIIFSTITFCEDESTEQHWEIVITTASTVRAYELSVRTDVRCCHFIAHCDLHVDVTSRHDTVGYALKCTKRSKQTHKVYNIKADSFIQIIHLKSVFSPHTNDRLQHK